MKTIEDRRQLQSHSLFGYEAKPLPYLLVQMNLLLHGLDAPKIDPGNALRFKLTEIGEQDRVDVILTNPPFGGEEEKGIQGNFPPDRQTSETVLLFLQLIMRRLRRDPSPGFGPSRAGVVVPDGLLFADSAVAINVKKELLTEFSLHTIVRLPTGVFAPYTPIPTNILFFERTQPIQDVWFYEHPLPEGRKTYTKTKPVEFKEFKPCLDWWTTREENERAWKVPVERLLGNRCDLDCRNPNRIRGIEHGQPEDLIDAIIKKEGQISQLMSEIKTALVK